MQTGERRAARLAVRYFRITSVLAIVCLLLLPGCHSVGLAPTKSVLGYNLLYDQGDELRSLLAKDDLAAASSLYAKNQKFFDEHRDAQAALLADFASKINGRYCEKAGTLAADLDYRQDEAAWAAQRQAILAAAALLKTYDDFLIVRDGRRRCVESIKLQARLNSVRTAYDANAVTALAGFGALSTRNFFSDYPIALREEPVLSAALPALTPRLEAMSSSDVLSFARLYRSQIRSDATEAAIGRLFLVAWLREQGRSIDPGKLAAAFHSLQSVGITSKHSGSTLLGIVLITGPGSDFAVTIDEDLPVEVAKLSSEEVSDARLAAFERALVVRVQRTTTTRKMVAQSRQASTLVAGYRNEHNPDYDRAEFAVIRAQSNLNSIRQQNAAASDGPQYTALQSIAGALAGAARVIAEQKAESALQQALQTLEKTPPTIEREIRQPYQYMATKVDDTKTADIDVFIVERGSGKARKFSRSLDVTGTFKLVYGVQDKDPEGNRIRAAAQTEDALSMWEKADLKLSALELLAKLRGQPATEVALAAIRLAPAVGSTTPRAHDRNIVHGDSTRSRDRRFNSVVIVENPSGALGTGFFVRNDVILTNRHVIEGAGFARIVTFDGQEATGKVIASDIQLDLALVRVSLNGRPVTFPHDSEIEPGTSVEAIGHPKGLTFSITRGIVSGHRLMRRGGGREVAYVQTDTPLSPGNSGGPLFHGNEVVGINTWSRADEGSQNLNFAIDYREAVMFIRDHL